MPSLTAKLDQLYSTSAVLPFDNSSRIVIMSDCHRGQGNGADNFLPNSMIFQGALEYYYQNGYTYIELGDGDELWENRCIGVILRTYSRLFRLLGQFQRENRLFLIYGNHDIVKRRKSFARAACDLTPEDLEAGRLKDECSNYGLYAGLTAIIGALAAPAESIVPTVICFVIAFAFLGLIVVKKRVPKASAVVVIAAMVMAAMLAK